MNNGLINSLTRKGDLRYSTESDFTILTFLFDRVLQSDEALEQIKGAKVFLLFLRQDKSSSD